MIQGRYITSEMAKILKTTCNQIKKYIKQGMPSQINDSGVITFDLEETITWLDENTEESKHESKTLSTKCGNGKSNIF